MSFLMINSLNCKHIFRPSWKYPPKEWPLLLTVRLLCVQSWSLEQLSYLLDFCIDPRHGTAICCHWSWCTCGVCPSQKLADSTQGCYFLVICQRLFCIYPAGSTRCLVGCGVGRMNTIGQISADGRWGGFSANSSPSVTSLSPPTDCPMGALTSSWDFQSCPTLLQIHI